MGGGTTVCDLEGDFDLEEDLEKESVFSLQLSEWLREFSLLLRDTE